MFPIFIKENKFFFGFLIFIFFGYLGMIFQPVEKLLVNFIVDDAFYYFKTASNIANGLGPTFDGENITNGYHPLWMGICALIYYLIPDDKILPIHIILSLSVLLYFASTLLIWKIISRWLFNKWAQITLVFAYALNPWNANVYLNGLETPLALFLLILSFFFFLKILEKKENNAGDFLVLGAVMGLMVLAKLDYAIFTAAVFLFFIYNILLQIIDKKYPERFVASGAEPSRRTAISWKPLLAFTVPAALIAAPWFLYNYFYFGSPVPASGLSYTMINHRLWFYKDRNLIQIIFWSIYNFLGVIVFNLKTIGISVSYSARDLIRSFFSLMAVFGPIILAAGYFYIYKKEQFKNFIKDFIGSAEGAAFIAFFIAYIGLVIVNGAIRWSGREWYFASFQFLTVIFLAIILSRSVLVSYNKIIAVILGILLLISFGYSWGRYFPQYANQLEMYRVAVWMRDIFPMDARIAAFNSGIHGYFSGHFLMNSDGLINNAAFEAMKKNSLWKLYEEERIDYIADYEITLTYRYKSFLGVDNPFDKLQKMDLPADIIRSGDYGGSHINIYKILK